jgi:hypothetical protein
MRVAPEEESRGGLLDRSIWSGRDTGGDRGCCSDEEGSRVPTKGEPRARSAAAASWSRVRVSMSVAGV